MLKYLIVFSLACTFSVSVKAEPSYVPCGFMAGDSVRYKLLLELTEEEASGFQAYTEYFIDNGFEAIADELFDQLEAWSENVPKSEREAERRLAEVRSEKTLWADYKRSVTSFLKEFDECAAYKDEVVYPGKAALEKRLSGLLDRFTDAEKENVPALAAELRAAKLEYTQSWEKTEGRDVSSYISDSNYYEFAYGSSTPWQQWRVNTRYGVCYGKEVMSLYSKSQYDEFAFYQTITGLPTGRYKLTARVMGRNGAPGEHRLFVRACDTVAVSSALVGDGFEYVDKNTFEIDTTAWETLVTDEMDVIDGNLTVGIMGRRVGGSEFGCLVTGFRLYYCGAVSGVDDLFSRALVRQRTRVSEKTEEMRYAGDKTEYLSALAELSATAEAPSAKYDSIEYPSSG